MVTPDHYSVAADRIVTAVLAVDDQELADLQAVAQQMSGHIPKGRPSPVTAEPLPANTRPEVGEAIKTYTDVVIGSAASRRGSNNGPNINRNVIYHTAESVVLNGGYVVRLVFGNGKGRAAAVAARFDLLLLSRRAARQEAALGALISGRDSAV